MVVYHHHLCNYDHHLHLLHCLLFESSNKFEIRENTQWNDKDRLFELILNSDKKQLRSNKTEQVEWKRIKNQAIQMLEDLGESYLDL